MTAAINLGEVCVCIKERERERKETLISVLVLYCMHTFACVCACVNRWSMLEQLPVLMTDLQLGGPGLSLTPADFVSQSQLSIPSPFCPLLIPNYAHVRAHMRPSPFLFFSLIVLCVSLLSRYHTSESCRLPIMKLLMVCHSFPLFAE